MRFSKRTDWNTEETELTLAHRQRIADGLPVIDLTASNPTRCGFDYPAGLLAPLSDPAALDYDPNPKGSLRAREAVCRYYAGHGVSADPGNLVLTTSTSEAYSYILKLLCNPGDAILVPQPCYPLFDFLADAEVVGLQYATFVYDHGWQLDLESLRRRITPTTRAIVLVHPNNPTGHFTKQEEARALAELCREHGLALIVDEVFLDYALEAGASEESRASFAARDLGILTFIVSGISKIAGLPQMKAAWLLAAGPGSEEALIRLEVLADTYLSMNAPIQRALPVWLDGRATMREQIHTRIRTNLALLDDALAGPGNNEGAGAWVSRLKIEGGWYAVLRIPATEVGECVARDLLDAGVFVHPGRFFGMPDAGWLVISLLTRPEEFSVGVARLCAHVRENQKSYGHTAKAKV
jgi:alanine-synthesizing transaminase